MFKRLLLEAATVLAAVIAYTWVIYTLGFKAGYESGASIWQHLIGG